MAGVPQKVKAFLQEEMKKQKIPIQGTGHSVQAIRFLRQSPCGYVHE